jgi:hypothetical protein
MKLLLILCCCIVLSASAQNPQQAPCSAPEAAQFDFWVGNWELSWKDSVRGTNRIEKLWGNCVVHENFNDPAQGYRGESWSVFSNRTRKWQQTWVDSRGGYIILTGGMEGNELILYTPLVDAPGGKVYYRMRYYNITPQSFDWSWDSSKDEKQTWQPAWTIHYKRKA